MHPADIGRLPISLPAIRALSHLGSFPALVPVMHQHDALRTKKAAAYL